MMVVIDAKAGALLLCQLGLDGFFLFVKEILSLKLQFGSANRQFTNFKKKISGVKNKFYVFVVSGLSTIIQEKLELQKFKLSSVVDFLQYSFLALINRKLKWLLSLSDPKFRCFSVTRKKACPSHGERACESSRITTFSQNFILTGEKQRFPGATTRVGSRKHDNGESWI